MNEYLIGFFTEFEYDNSDRQHLFSAYETIIANEQANRLVKEILAAYEKSISMDYQKELFHRTRQISQLSGVHEYTVELLAFILMSKHLKEVYSEKGLDMQIYKDSVFDLKWKLAECKAVKGICGSFVSPWFCGFFDLTRFALGRLQFEVITTWQDYEKEGIKLEADKSKVINVHIPRTGTPLDKESCDKSYALARDFFKDQVGENCPFVCYSWLLYPENKNILPSDTNTYRFMSEYDIIGWEVNDGEDLWRLFDTEEKDPHRLPSDSSMRRCYIEHLKKGGKVGCGFGVKL
ncbi:MAG: DUF5596 domain-containing protein [Oscillospiraceae bacterium]|nr:DUF5596 domain-containing protein [Oscillospiraceae bacterium]